MASLNLLTYSAVYSFGGSTINDQCIKSAYDTSNNIYVIGIIDSSKGFIGKIEATAPNNTFIWTRTLTGTTNINLRSITVDASNNIYIFGSTNSASITFNGTTYTGGTGTTTDLFFFKIDTSGNYVLLNWITSTSNLGDPDIKVDNNNNLLIIGSAKNTLTYNNNGSLSTIPITATNYNTFVLKLDILTLGILWSNLMSITSNIDYYAWGLAYDNLNNVYVCYITSSSTGGIIKYNGYTGALITSTTINNSGLYIVSDIQNNIYVTFFKTSTNIQIGSTNYTAPTNNNIIIAKLNSNLISQKIQFCKTFGSTTTLYGLAIDKYQNLYINGGMALAIFNITIDGLVYGHSGDGTSNFYVLKVDKNLNHVYLEYQNSGDHDYALNVAINNNTNQIYVAGYHTSEYPLSMTFGNSSIPISNNAFLLKMNQTQPMILKYTNVANSTIQLGIIGITNCVVDWGDGTTQTISSQLPTRTYGAGITDVTIKIIGSFTTYGPGQSVLTNAGKLSECVSFGSIPLTSISGAFRYATNLTSVPATIPSTVTNLNFVFDGASNFNSDISLWDTSNVTGMLATFYGASKFNSPINTNGVCWNTSKVTTMSEMFYGCSLFNQDISLWDVSKVTTMAGMFNSATNFNKNISGWNTALVSTMLNMFSGCSVFNQNVSTWNVSSLTTSSFMFRQASQFNQPFVNGSILFQNSNASTISIINNNDADFSLDGNFTIEWWQYQTDFNASPRIFSIGTSSSAKIGFEIQGSGAYYTNLIINGTPYNFALSTSYAYKNQWIHFAIVRNSGTIKLFKNGTQLGSNLSNSEIISTSAFPLVIGNETISVSNNTQFGGNITNFRWVKGNAVYTSNFVPSTTALYNVAGTKLLFQTSSSLSVYNDSAVSGKTINNNNTQWSSLTPLTTWSSTLLTNTSRMFEKASNFNQIINWNVPNVSNMSLMFSECFQFNQDLSYWNVSNVTNMNSMFIYATSFNQDISNWNISNVTNMSNMLIPSGMDIINYSKILIKWSFLSVKSGVTFAVGSDSGLGSKYYSNVAAYKSILTSPPNNWNIIDDGIITSEDTILPSILLYNGISSGTVISLPIMGISTGSINWDQPSTSSITTISTLTNNPNFTYTSNLSSVVIFVYGSFTSLSSYVNGGQILGSSKLTRFIDYGSEESSITSMVNAFYGCSSLISVPSALPTNLNLTSLEGCFKNASSFNQNISTLSVLNITNLNSMFENALAFNQNLSNWNVVNVLSASNMFNSSGLSISNYTNILIGWASLGNSLKSSVIFGALNKQYYTSAISARAYLTNNIPSGKNWSINDSGILFEPLQLEYINMTNNTIIQLPIKNITSSISIDWGDNSPLETFSTSYPQHTYTNAPSSTIIIKIYGTVVGDNFSSIYNTFNTFTCYNSNTSNAITNVSKLSRVLDWGDISSVNINNNLTSLEYGFYNASSFTSIASLPPSVTNVSRMFQGATSFNQNISSWNTSAITNMSYMFYGASAFNQDISSWNFSNVVNLTGMFLSAIAFNNGSLSTHMNITSFKTTGSVLMDSMFEGASAFNKDITQWNTIAVSSMSNMFKSAILFNQNINRNGSYWNVSNVKNMISMFQGAIAFNQNLNNWNVSGVNPASPDLGNMTNIFTNSGLSYVNLTYILIGWGNVSGLKSGVTLGANGLYYYSEASSSVSTLQNLQNNWIVNSLGVYGPIPIPMVLTYYGININDDIQLPIKNYGSGLNITIDWGDGIIETNVIAQNKTHRYTTNRSNITTIITISFLNYGAFTKFGLNSLAETILGISKLTGISSFGNLQLTSLEGAFYNATTLTSVPSSLPSTILSLKNTFNGATSFNQNISNWNISNITDLTGTFNNATNFNQNLSSWIIQNVGLNSGNMSNLFTNSRLSEINYTSILIGWASQTPNIRPNLTLGANNINYYSEANNSKLLLENSPYNWSINDGIEIGITPTPMILTYINITNGTQITLPIKNIIYDININWGDGTITRSTQSAPNLSYTYNGSVSEPTITITPIRINSFNKFGLDTLANPVEVISGINKLTGISSFGNLQLTSLEGAFYNATSLLSVPNIIPSTVQNVSNMFYGATSFDQDLTNWNTSNITNMSGMFNGAIIFNSNISTWITTSVIDFSSMFKNAKLFNKNINTNTNLGQGYWITSSAQSMNSMFEGAEAFEQSLNNWNVSNVSTMASMFKNTKSFNGLISSWTVSNVVDMSSMFEGISAQEPNIFNRDISGWVLFTNPNTTINLSSMFKNATNFNQNISLWNTSRVSNMASMFNNSSNFNQNISNWSVSNVSNMTSMFQNASLFNQNLNDWNVASLTNAASMFNNSGLSNLNYSLILKGWGSLGTLQSSVFLGASTDQYYPSSTFFRDYLTKIKTWTITDNGVLPTEPIQFEYINITPGTTIELPIRDLTNSLTIDWGNNIITSNNNSNFPSHTYQSAFSSIVIIVSGTFTTITSAKTTSPSVSVVSGNSKLKTVFSYGSNSVNLTNMSYGFYGCSSLIEIPLLPLTVSNTSYMFYGASLFNQDISGWTTSAITNMSYMFYGASLFNQDISYWDTSLVQNMSGMFENGTNFNKNLGSWSTGAVTNMSNMFNNAANYNGIFENGSIYIGANNFISILNDEDIRFGTGDFTIEWWQYATSGNSTLFTMKTDEDELFTVRQSGTYIQSFYNNINTNIASLDPDDSPYLNTWLHIVVLKTGTGSTSSRVYINGKFNRSTPVFNVNFNHPTEPFKIFSSGYITNFRITKGAAVYTSNFDRYDLKLNVKSNVKLFFPTINSSSFLNNISSSPKLIINNGCTWSNKSPWITRDLNDIIILNNGHNISDWTTSAVINMSGMFKNALAFNQLINTNGTKWNVLNVQNMSSMFENARAFNQNISGWNVSQIQTTENMFKDAQIFNQNISGWVFTNQLTNINNMFYGATLFNVNIGSWNIKQVSLMGNLFVNTALSNQNYTDILVGWYSYGNDLITQPPNNKMLLNAGGVKYYTAAKVPRSYLTINKNWDIIDGGFLPVPSSFQYINVLSNTEIRLPIKNIVGIEGIGGTVNINWGEGVIEQVSSDYPYHKYSANFSAIPQTVTITVLGGFNNVSSFNGSSIITGTDKLYRVATFADSAPYINNCEYAFYGASALIEVPTLPTTVTTTAHMFQGAVSFNQDISGWNTSSVIDMTSMFEGATAFNSNINTWSVINVQYMSSMFKNATNFNSPLSNLSTLSLKYTDSMFYGASVFNQDITNFNMSNVLSSAYMFYNASVFNNGDTGNNGAKSLGIWNTEKITDMSYMFNGCTNFNQSVAGWDVKKVISMESMFRDALIFNQNLLTWITELNQSMKSMFEGCQEFNQSLVNWTTSEVSTIESVFKNAYNFNGDISYWDTESVTNMSSAFSGARKFNQDISNWNTSAVQNMSNMFNGALEYNNNYTGLNTNTNVVPNRWNVSNVSNMSGMFKDANSFNQQINNWNTSNVLDMSEMFLNALIFNQNISQWNTSNVVDMAGMFENALIFNQPINTDNTDVLKWNVSKVENMTGMFKNATSFDNSISNWNTSKVENMSSMFEGASLFNKPIDTNLAKWNVSVVSDMSKMFKNATQFNQSLSTWNIIMVETMSEMLSNSGLSPYNYSLLLTSWSLLNVKENVPLGANGIKYFTSAQTARNYLTNSTPAGKNWTIIDNGSTTTPIQFKYINILNNNTIQLPIQTIITGNLTIDWGDSTAPTITGNPFPNHTYLNNYDYVIITVFGNVSHISTFNPITSTLIDGTNKLEKVLSYGDNGNQIDNFEYAYYQATSLIELPLLPTTANTLKYMLNGASSFNQNISDWNVSNVVYMDNMLIGSDLSNQNYTNLLNGWASYANSLEQSVRLDASSYYYPEAIVSRNYLITEKLWIINDNGIQNIPVVYNLNYTTYTNNSREIVLKATDLDIPQQTLTYQITLQPTHGTLSSINVDKVIYTPFNDYSGPDIFSYTATDNIDISNTGNVDINVRSLSAQNTSVRDNVISETNSVFGSGVVPEQIITKIVNDIIQINANLTTEQNLAIYLGLLNTYKFGATISVVDQGITYSIVLNTVEKKDALHRCIRKELCENNLQNFKVSLLTDKQLLQSSLDVAISNTVLSNRDINIFITNPYALTTEMINISTINMTTETIFVELYNDELLDILNAGITKRIQMKYSGLSTAPVRYIIKDAINYYLGSRFYVGVKDINIIGFGSIYGGGELEFEGGNGTINNPYQIASWNQLSNVRNYLTSGIYFILNQNLSYLNLGYANNVRTPEGLVENGFGWLPIAGQTNIFLGIFNGNNKSISNLEINRPLQSNIGLFGHNGLSSLVKNLGILNAVIIGNDNTGSIIGHNNYGSLESCYMDSNSLTGPTTPTTLATIITGDLYVGGLVGNNNNSNIEKSYSNGTINGTSYVGGITGYNNGGNIANSYSVSSVFGTSVSSLYIGGLIGKNLNATVAYCYSAGVVQFTQVGGNQIGGLIGNNESSTLTGNVWDSETSLRRTSSGGISKTRVQMKIKETFISLGWNFNTVWDIIEAPLNACYPFLILPEQIPPPGNEDLGSILLNGTSTSYLSIPNDEIVPGVGYFDINTDSDFTVEWFQYQTDSNIRPTIFSIGSEEPNLFFGVTIEERQFKLWINGTANPVNTLFNISEYKNKWVHFAVVRKSNIISIYKDGLSIHSFTYSNSINGGVDINLLIGNQNDFSSESSFGGYITNFRFVKGFSVYEGNFTPITRPLGNVLGTLVLLLTSDQEHSLTDSSSSPLTITGNNHNWNINTPFIFNETPGPEPEPAPEPAPEPEPETGGFELEYLVPNNGTITLPFRGNANVVIFWHDQPETRQNYISQNASNVNHTYTTGGTYVVKIYGTLSQFGSDNLTYPNADKLRRVFSFGTLGLTSLAGAFRNAVNLIALPSFLPSSVINLKYLLYGAVLFNDPNITQWNTANVENMSYMLFQATAFDQDIYGWNISNVKNRKFIFYGCDAYQQDTDGWFLDKILNLAVRI